MENSSLTAKGQLLIPKRIRTKYGFKPGTRVLFEETEHGVIIRPMDAAFFDSFIGILKQGNLKEDMRQMKDEEMQLEERSSPTETP
jgi:AbrB family looped-hinge helix DNA binding protein